MHTSTRRAALSPGLACVLFALAGVASAVTSYKQPSFHETVVFSGLVNPSVVRFLPDGRVLVAEKSGLVKIFPNLATNVPTTVVDLRTQVHNFWDRGLLGLAVDPDFVNNNAIYVLYAHDAAIGGAAPRWGTPGASSDPCPAPPAGPGATTDGCVISGRLSRLTAVGSDWSASEQVLIEDWCQQYPSHSTGSLAFGADGYLYVTGGDGASFNNSDWGQFGGTVGVPGQPGVFYTPANPCGDPPFATGTPQTKPTAEGGALRSQSPRRTAGEPRLLNGSLLRVDPATGLAAPGNPLGGSADLNEQRIVGYGLRNPFRMIVKPGTSEVWIADVGWNTWEELDRLPDLTSARNFGWPCYEGNATQYTGLSICPAPIGQTTTPFYTYAHSASVVPGDGCPTGSSSVAGMAFYQGGSNYPAAYQDALFFSDYSRKCMWVMFPDGAGTPDPATRAAFASAAQGPVDLTIGPDGNLYYADFDGGRILRVEYGPVAKATGAPLTGDAPLTVTFSSAGSAPAQPGDTITLAWDLDGDGEFDDATIASPTATYPDPGTHLIRLQVTDNHGASNVSSPVTVSVGNTAPTAVIDTPLPALTWQVNETIVFSGHATDPQQGALPDSALSWVVKIQHCPSNCHTHVYQTFDGVAGGSFPAPDHEYPSYLEIELTAKDSGNLTTTTSLAIQPQTVNLQFETAPAGLQLSAGTFTGAAPFTRTVILGSAVAVDALAPQGAFPDVWDFSAWSDAGAEQHTLTASAPGTFVATYVTHADLSIAASASPEPVDAGATLTYTIQVGNAGPSQAASLSTSTTLPPGAALVSASGAGWSCSGTGPVTCTRASLGIAAAPPITIVAAAPTEGGPAGSTSTIGAATADAVTANNSVTATSTVIARSDLGIGQSGGPASICAGQPITYLLAVSNLGPSTAAAVSVVDVLPAGASLVSATGTGWSCSGATTVTCTRASLAPGAAPVISVAIDAPGSAGAVSNAVSVSSEVPDPASANNGSSAPTTVVAIPTAPLASNGGAVCAGDTLHLTAQGAPGATYHWTGPDGFDSTDQNPAIPNATAAASGTYSVTAGVEGCVSPAATTTALVRPRPSAAVSGDAAICAGGTAQLTASLQGSGPWTLTWSDGFVQPTSVTPAHRDVSPGATTTYTVTSVADVHCASTGTGFAVVVVGEPPAAPAITAPLFAAIGATGLAASVEARDGSTYAWSIVGGAIDSGSSTAAVTFSAGPPGTTMELSVVETNATCASPAGAWKVQVDFLDVPPQHVFHDFVDAIARGGVTAGCGEGNYCPDASNTRAQMAVFLLKSKLGADHVPPPAIGLFADVPVDDPFAPWVEEAAALQVTAGCGGGRFCPAAPVTRAQMAVFLLKTLEGFDYTPPPATGVLFEDVPPDAFAASWIEELYARGVTGGCQTAPLRYCPGTPVTRGQMAVFLVKTFGL